MSFCQQLRRPVVRLLASGTYAPIELKNFRICVTIH
jgi:hypothetical protein